MKTLFITIYDGAMSKNILRTDIFRVLKAQYRIVLFVPSVKFQYFKEEFASDTVIVEPAPLPSRPRFEALFNALSLHMLHTGTVKQKIFTHFSKTRNPVSFLTKLFLWSIGRFHSVHRLFRFIYAHVPDTSFDEYVLTYRPVAMFLPNMMSNEDYRLIKVARKHGILSIGLPKSWDNFTSKTFFNILPDWMMVQNPIMQREAIELFGYPKDRMSIIGFPQFDVYADRSRLLSRESFCKSLGLDPDKKIILYAAAGQQLAPHDEEVLAILIARIEKDQDLRQDVQILVRPHPKYDFNEGVIPKKPFVVVDYPGIMAGPKRGHWEFRDDDIHHLMNSLYHMDMLVSTVSTLNLEGAIFDKPLISVGFDGRQDKTFAHSVARYYRYDHMLPIVQSGGMSVAYSEDALVEQIRAYCANPALHRDERKKIVEEVVWKTDGKAGERIGNFIVEKVGT